MTAPRSAAAALAAVAIAAVLAYTAGSLLDVPALRLAAKPVPALVLAAWAATSRPGALRTGIVLGLLLSAVGDLVLEGGWFLPGLVAFLLAHVAYTVSFVATRRELLPLRALMPAAYGLSVFLALRTGLGPMALPVGAYVCVICTMLWRAAARVGDTRSPAATPWLGLAGALSFAASDTLIAFDRFHAPIAYASLPILGLYWLGQWGIAASCRPGYGMLRRQVSPP